MAEELYPGASFAAPFAEASAMAPLSQIPTNILQSLQAARASARADDALALQQETFAFNREATLRKQKLQDVDRELTSQLDNPAVSRSRGGYGGSSRYGGEVGPAGVASMGLRKGSKAQAALAPQIQAEQGVFSGLPTQEEYIRDYGSRADEQHRAYQKQQEALEGRDFTGATFAPALESADEAGEVFDLAPSSIYDAAFKEGTGAETTVEALMQIVGQARSKGGAQFYGPDDLADLLVAEEAKLITGGYTDISDELMTQVVRDVWRSGPRPPEDASNIDKTARQLLDLYPLDGEPEQTEAEALRTLEARGFHPEQAAAVIARVGEIAPAYRSDRTLRDLGLLKPGQSALTESDMEKNPATFFGLPPDYSRTPDQFAHQIYRTEWGKDVDGRAKAQVLEQYRGWYKDRVSDRRKEVVRRLDADKGRRLEAQESAFEAKIQSFMDMGRSGRAPKEMRKDSARLRQWAVPQVMQDPAFLALVSQYSAEQKSRIAAGPKWAEYNRKKRIDKRNIELEDDRTQAEYNKRAAGIATDPTNVELLKEYGIALVDSEGNYRPSQEIINDLKMVRSERGGGAGNLEKIELISEQFGSAETESKSRRAQKRVDPDADSEGGTTTSQKQRGLDQVRRIHDQAYIIKLKGTEIPKHMLKDLERASEAASFGASPQVRREANDRANGIRADLAARAESQGIVWGDPSLLSPSQADGIKEARSVSGLDSGGGGDVDLGITSGSETSTDPVQDKMTRLGFVWNATKRVFEKTREDGKVQSVDYARASRVDE